MANDISGDIARAIREKRDAAMTNWEDGSIHDAD